jgi:DNA helicase HerA-like ATPase
MSAIADKNRERITNIFLPTQIIKTMNFSEYIFTFWYFESESLIIIYFKEKKYTIFDFQFFDNLRGRFSVHGSSVYRKFICDNTKNCIFFILCFFFVFFIIFQDGERCNTLLKQRLSLLKLSKMNDFFLNTLLFLYQFHVSKILVIINLSLILWLLTILNFRNLCNWLMIISQ